MITTIKNKWIEILSLIIAILALYTSCSDHKYIEANYYDSQQEVIVSSPIAEEKNKVRLKTASDSKYLISSEITFPKDFETKKYYVSSDGIFELDKELSDEIIKRIEFKNNTQEKKKNIVSLPIKLWARYIANGDVYDNLFIYELKIKVEMEPNKNKQSIIKIVGLELNYLNRFPDSLLFDFWMMAFGMDKAYDIDYMFNNHEVWQSMNTPHTL